MDLKRLIAAAEKPPVYEKADSVMWTDEYISEQLLQMHLNPDIDAATRNPESVDKTIEFILDYCDASQMDILDLGCGPGLYCKRLAGYGHHLTGVDFSENSISYAKKDAQQEGLKINYLHQNYLDLDFEDEFDLAMIIYTDLGVLSPDDRRKFLENVYKALKPGGTFVFDVLNDKNVEEKFPEQQTWSIAQGGFWKPDPCLELKSGFLYPADRVFLQQHIVINESEHLNTYRFWTHYFNVDEIQVILKKAKFIDIEYFEDILPATNVWDGENVTFYKCVKG